MSQVPLLKSTTPTYRLVVGLLWLKCLLINKDTNKKSILNEFSFILKSTFIGFIYTVLMHVVFLQFVNLTKYKICDNAIRFHKTTFLKF